MAFDSPHVWLSYPTYEPPEPLAQFSPLTISYNSTKFRKTRNNVQYYDDSDITCENGADFRVAWTKLPLKTALENIGSTPV